MTISRRDFLKGTAGTVGAAALASPAAALGQSDSSVIDYIRSNFNYDSNNQYFTDEAVERAEDALARKADAVKDTIDALNEYTELRSLSADDLPKLDRMTSSYGSSAAGGLERIHGQIGQPLPHSMMREWFDFHLYDHNTYPAQQTRIEWYRSPQELAADMEALDIQFLYHDLLDLAFWRIPNKEVQPRPVTLDVGFIEELEQLALNGEQGLRSQDRPTLDRRYLYEHLQNTGQEELLFDREMLESAYQQIMWQRQHQQRPDRRAQMQEAQENGVNISPGSYSQVASALSSTALAYIHLSDQLITEDTLAHLKELVLGDFEDKTTEWGGRVMIRDGRLHFQKDPVAERGNDKVLRRTTPDKIAADFSQWHTQALQLSYYSNAGPSHTDLIANSDRGMPEFVITPLGQRGDTLRMNIDIYQVSGNCSYYRSQNTCPHPRRTDMDSFIVDLGIFEG